jgi:PKD repeat protein
VTGLSAQHTYAEEGIYPVTFTASNRGSTDSMTQRVQVIAPPELAGIDVHPPEPAARTSVRFTAQVKGTAPLTYHWDLGDGTQSEAERPEHRYDEPGDYTITLTVENAVGAADATLQISVQKSRGRRSRRTD